MRGARADGGKSCKHVLSIKIILLYQSLYLSLVWYTYTMHVLYTYIYVYSNDVPFKIDDG